MKSKCQNCEKIWEEEELNTVFPCMEGIKDRIAPGEEVPVGECPECYSLTHIWTDPAESGVNLFAPGLADPECAAAAEAALDKRTHADYQCYMMLKQLIRDFQSGMHPNEPEAIEMIAEAREMIDDRELYNDKFLRAVAGRKG